MPGLSIYDFGDSIRFGANHSAEDEKNLSKVNFDIELYKCYTRGFLESAQGVLTDTELEYLPWGAKLMILECGIRFLTDYLDGDHYFHIHYPEQNLDRCRTQFKLVADMETQCFFSAPDRKENSGNHTDHRHGCVLAEAVNLEKASALAGRSISRPQCHR